MVEKQIEDYLKILLDQGVISPQVYEDENIRVRSLAHEMVQVHKATEEEAQKALEFEFKKLKNRFGTPESGQ